MRAWAVIYLMQHAPDDTPRCCRRRRVRANFDVRRRVRYRRVVARCCVA